MPGPRETALEFVRRFAAGDVEGLAELLAERLELSGPLVDVDSRADYLKALRQDPPEPSEMRVLDVRERGDSVTVRWTYEKPGGALEVEQDFEVSGGKIHRSRLRF